MRILVPEIKHCYAVLGSVHGLWRNIPNEFDDYIANPEGRLPFFAYRGYWPTKANIEIQIRTFKMHEEAEFESVPIGAIKAVTTGRQ